MSLPTWYKRRREIALKLLKEARPARYGPDIDLDSYKLEAIKREPIASLRDLPELRIARSVGIREDEQYRSGTYLQYDNDVIYLKLAGEVLPKGLVVDNLVEAIRKYEWLRRFWFRACPLNLDKYTTFVGAHETAGAFIWCKREVHVEQPVQACLFMGTERMAQVPHNIIILEPGSSLHVITGCAVSPRRSRAAHVACTEIYVGENAELTWTMIHNWRPDTHVRPRMGALVEKGGTLMVNYALLSSVRSIQFYPTVVLLGEGARAGFRNLMLALGRSMIDAGSAIIFNARETRGEIVSRAVVKDEADLRMRGRLWGRKPGAKGHVECGALLLSSKAKAYAYPSLQSDVKDVELTHEAAVGRIAEEELFYLMSRGLEQDEAVALLSKGFLDTDIPGLPTELSIEIRRIISATIEHVL